MKAASNDSTTVLVKGLAIKDGITKATESSPAEIPKCSGRAAVELHVNNRYMIKSKRHCVILTPLWSASSARNPTPIPPIMATRSLVANTAAYSGGRKILSK
jgi:hypothetical protein